MVKTFSTGMPLNFYSTCARAQVLQKDESFHYELEYLFIYYYL